MPKFIDYTGKKIGRLKFIDFFKKGVKHRWNCICDCGQEGSYRTDYINKMMKKGVEFECLRCKEERRWPDLSDKVFGRLTVIKLARTDESGRWYLCKCECGREKEINSSHLTKTSSTPTRSCGCYARKLHSKWANTTRYPPAHGFRTPRCSDYDRRIYVSRTRIIAKCYRKEDVSYPLFGGIGITVCDLWRNSAKDFRDWSIENGFQKGFSLRLKEGAFEFNPSNCFWEIKGAWNRK